MADEREDDERNPEDVAPGGLGVHDLPKHDAAPGQSSASDWDMSRSKPSGDSAASGQDRSGTGAGRKQGSS